VRSLRPQAEIVLISNTLHFASIHQLLQQGIKGYLYKEDHLADNLVHAIETVSRGQLYLSPKVSALPYLEAQRAHVRGLNARDLQVLKLMYQGKTVQHIAQILMLKDRAVYRSQEKLRRALCVPTTELIVMAAMRSGWIADLQG
jgi:two-component system invasion response regulator UvrY